MVVGGKDEDAQTAAGVRLCTARSQSRSATHFDVDNALVKEIYSCRRNSVLGCHSN